MPAISQGAVLRSLVGSAEHSSYLPQPLTRFLSLGAPGTSAATEQLPAKQTPSPYKETDGVTLLSVVLTRLAGKYF